MLRTGILPKAAVHKSYRHFVCSSQSDDSQEPFCDTEEIQVKRYPSHANKSYMEEYQFKFWLENQLSTFRELQEYKVLYKKEIILFIDITSLCRKHTYHPSCQPVFLLTKMTAGSILLILFWNLGYPFFVVVVEVTCKCFFLCTQFSWCVQNLCLYRCETEFVVAVNKANNY